MKYENPHDMFYIFMRKGSVEYSKVIFGFCLGKNTKYSKVSSINIIEIVNRGLLSTTMHTCDLEIVFCHLIETFLIDTIAWFWCRVTDEGLLPNDRLADILFVVPDLYK